MLLFRFCRFCKYANPSIEATASGTQLVIRSICINTDCLREDTWYSQPKMTGTKNSSRQFPPQHVNVARRRVHIKGSADLPAHESCNNIIANILQTPAGGD